jgi:hypothetical protein
VPSEGEEAGQEFVGNDDDQTEERKAREEELQANPPSPLAILRNDIGLDAPVNTGKPGLQLGTCVETVRIPVPQFQTTFDGPMDSQLQTVMKIEQVEVPARLSSDVIRKVKGYVMSKMHTFDPMMGQIGPDPLRTAYLDLKWVNKTSGFVHPAGTVGPAELALLKVGYSNVPFRQRGCHHVHFGGGGGGGAPCPERPSGTGPC